MTVFLIKTQKKTFVIFHGVLKFNETLKPPFSNKKNYILNNFYLNLWVLDVSMTHQELLVVAELEGADGAGVNFLSFDSLAGVQVTFQQGHLLEVVGTKVAAKGQTGLDRFQLKVFYLEVDDEQADIFENFETKVAAVVKSQVLCV